MNKFNSKWRPLCAVLILLAGCSSGDGERPARPGVESSTPSAVTGFWQGSATDTASGEVMSATAFIGEYGDAQWLVFPPVIVFSPSPLPAAGLFGGTTSRLPFAIHGNVCCSAWFDSNLTGQVLAGTQGTAVKLNGNLDSGLLVGQFSYEGKQYSFSLAQSVRFLEGVTLADLQGVYSSDATPGGTPMYTLTVASDGVITGQHTSGCIYNGRLSVPNDRHNLFKLEIDIAGCPANIGLPRDGHYNGLGTLIRDANVYGYPTPRQFLYFSLIGPVWIGTHGGVRT